MSPHQNQFFDGRFNQQIKGNLLDTKYDVVVIGGGLAGLVSSFLLAKDGKSVVLVEKKKYPFHRVCGEYVSNETRNFLERHKLLPDDISLPEINRFQFTDTHGKAAVIKLDLGGFGISRYLLDNWIYKRCLEVGVSVLQSTQVESIDFDPETDCFFSTLSNHDILNSTYVIGAFGKRSKLDKVLNRDFIKKRSPYLGVKYHVKTDLPLDLVSLHNFHGGYCGANAVEEGRFNLCYLGSRDQLRAAGNIPEMEEKFLFKNPVLKEIFQTAEFLFDKPEVINEINFDPKAPVENHMLMAGDSAGLITPLCGNGMAIAIQSGKLAAEAILAGGQREKIESTYANQWSGLFKGRLKLGRTVQKLFGSPKASSFTRALIHNVPFAADQIIRNTHGQPF